MQNTRMLNNIDQITLLCLIRCLGREPFNSVSTIFKLNVFTSVQNKLMSFLESVSLKMKTVYNRTENIVHVINLL